MKIKQGKRHGPMGRAVILILTFTDSECLPAEREDVRVRAEVRDAVTDEDAVKIVLLDVRFEAGAVVAQVEDMYLGKVVEQEREEAVRVAVADNEQTGLALSAVTISCRGQLPPIKVEYLSFFSRKLKS